MIGGFEKGCVLSKIDAAEMAKRIVEYLGNTYNEPPV